MKICHALSQFLLFGNRVISLYQLYINSLDGYKGQFFTLLSIIVLERMIYIVYSQYCIYQKYNSIKISIAQILLSLVFLDFLNSGLFRKAFKNQHNKLIIRNMNLTVHFLSIIPLVMDMICINFLKNGEYEQRVYEAIVLYLIFNMAFTSTRQIYHSQNNVPLYRYFFTFSLQYIRSYSIWSVSSQLLFELKPIILIYFIWIFLSTLLFIGISKDGHLNHIPQNRYFINHPFYNNHNNLNKKQDKSRVFQLMITQILMLVQIDNYWAFKNSEDSQPSIQKVAQSISVYIYYLIIFVIKICSYTFINHYDLICYGYAFLCVFEIYLAFQNMLFYQKYGPYQESILMKHIGPLCSLNLEKSIVEKYKGKILLTKFNFNIELEKSQIHEDLKIKSQDFSKHICSILFNVSKNQCRITINVSNEEELILSRKDTEIIFGIKRGTNNIIISFLLSLYCNIQQINQYQKSKALNIYFTDKEQLSVSLNLLEKALIQASQICIQPKMILNFKGIQTFNSMNTIFQQQYLMIFLFNSQISDFMFINPSAILYDLYEDSFSDN